MPRRAAARMLCLAVAVALLACAPARADLIPDEVDLAGNGVALPPAVKTVLDQQQALGLLTYDAREPFYTLVKLKTTVPFPLTPLTPSGLIALVTGLPGLRFAEQNVTLKTQDAPNDPLLPQEDQLGPLFAQQAWGTTNGSGVTIGIVDSGVQLDHPDLAPNIRNQGTNLRARNGSNGADDQGHGTEGAGAAAARGGNGVGGAGGAPGAPGRPAQGG